MQIPLGGVAFFDSGIGGLTVLSECKKYIPNEIFYYYGDNARAPYGNRSPESIRSYVDEAFALFTALQVKAVVLACNTATAVCAEWLRAKYPFPIVGAEPAVLPAASGGGEVFVLSTRATGESKRFSRLCNKTQARFPKTKLTPVLCDELAGEIEKHIFEPEFSYASFLPAGNPDAVVLGCTHYIYIKKYIRTFYQCKTFDGNEGIARRLRFLLSRDHACRVCEKNWDERPLFSTFCPQGGIFCAEAAEKYAEVAYLKDGKNPPIFFLGDHGGYNKRVFEQMFGK